MKKSIVTIAFIAGLIMTSTTPPAAAEDPGPESAAGITESYVMLYYRDLGPPRRFYGRLLGLVATYDDDWVTLYRLTPTSLIGVVREGNGAYHKAKADNAVMLSVVVEDVDAWYARLKETGEIRILKEIYNNANAPIRAFLIEDPGGYTVEFFQWLNP